MVARRCQPVVAWPQSTDRGSASAGSDGTFDARRNRPREQPPLLLVVHEHTHHTAAAGSSRLPNARLYPDAGNNDSGRTVVGDVTSSMFSESAATLVTLDTSVISLLQRELPSAQITIATSSPPITIRTRSRPEPSMNGW